MPKFRFEIVRTIFGLPDPGSYERGMSYDPALDGCAQEVIEEFESEEIAMLQACTHNSGHNSTLWNKYCPPLFKHTSDEEGGGLDVIYIGPVTEDWFAECVNLASEACAEESEQWEQVREQEQTKYADGLLEFETRPPRHLRKKRRQKNGRC